MEKRYYLASGAVVTGDVELGNDVSIWHNAVLRGDSGKITIGDRTNIQDGCIVHEETRIGADCTVGHGAIVHGCTVGDGCLIGMGAIVLNGAVLGAGCLVGAGAVVTGKTNAPAGSVLLGSPAKIVKELTAEQMQQQKQDAMHYVELARKTLA
ncbi:MAG: gamma carbonic anhydrase family protein [Oscillospiraceae bacterium]|nr:gamma carbonic anhydrase family protein [Oscillospiraceae bacterium]